MGSPNLVCSPVSSNASHLGSSSYASVADLSTRKPESTLHPDLYHHFEHPLADNNAKMHPQTGRIIADGDMDLSMGYCYDRGGGQFTRLVPVDILPVDLKDIPRRVTTDEGMIVLPVPRKGGPGGQMANIQLEPQHVVTVSCSVPIMICCARIVGEDHGHVVGELWLTCLLVFA